MISFSSFYYVTSWLYCPLTLLVSSKGDPTLTKDRSLNPLVVFLWPINIIFFVIDKFSQDCDTSGEIVKRVADESRVGMYNAFIKITALPSTAGIFLIESFMPMLLATLLLLTLQGWLCRLDNYWFFDILLLPEAYISFLELDSFGTLILLRTSRSSDWQLIQSSSFKGVENLSNTKTWLTLALIIGETTELNAWLSLPLSCY